MFHASSRQLTKTDDEEDVSENIKYKSASRVIKYMYLISIFFKDVVSFVNATVYAYKLNNALKCFNVRYCVMKLCLHIPLKSTSLKELII